MSKKRKLFLTSYSLTPLEKIPSCGILCEHGRIIGIGGASSFSMIEDGLEVIDLTGSYALPGFIDSHIHGIDDVDAASADRIPDALEQISTLLIKHGVTTFCPTLAARPPDTMLKLISAITDQIEKGVSGADPIALHLEGPFINKTKRGSMDQDAVFDKIDFGYAKELLEAGRGRIKLQTFAPELEDSTKLVEMMMEYGAIPSMGHSAASGEEASRCIDAGAKRCTYIFNGMKQLYHRESSLTSTALIDDRVSVEMICDGIHLHPCFVDLVTRCKKKDKIIGISNAVVGSGPIVVNKDGAITGATMTLEHSWRHLMSYAAMEPSLAAQCFTKNPAGNLGLYSRGELLPGRRADMTFFDVKTNQVRATVIKGELVYHTELN